MPSSYLQVLFLATIIIIYALARKYLAGRLVFIFPVAGGLLAYTFFLSLTNKDALIEMGISKISLGFSSILTLLVFSPVILIMIIFCIFKGQFPPKKHFYIALLVYPFWGFAQQFIFQAIFHTRLIELGLAPQSILYVTVFFALAHLPNLRLVAFSFVLGLLFSTIFFITRNILPLSIIHGILGAIYFDLWLGGKTYEKLAAAYRNFKDNL